MAAGRLIVVHLVGVGFGLEHAIWFHEDSGQEVVAHGLIILFRAVERHGLMSEGVNLREKSRKSRETNHTDAV